MKKICDPTKHVIVEFDGDTIDLGGLPDIFKKIMMAVHHTNVNSDSTYCAITFPQVEKDKGLSIGERVVVYGSESVLEMFVKNNFVTEMKRKGMIFISRIKETDMTTEDGVYVSKVRKQHITENYIASVNRRREKRGHNAISSIAKKIVEIEGEIARIFCCIKKDLFLNMSIGEKKFVGGDSIMVSSYGISSQSELAILPKI